MNTSDIDEAMAGESSYAGTYPCNRIKLDSNRPCAYIINTNRWPDDGDPGHWVAVVLLPGFKAEYFDSFGLMPLQPDILSFVKKYCRNGLKWNNMTLQSYDSRVCGCYCVDFVRSRLDGISLKKYLTLFKTDTRFNDSFVLERLTCPSSTLPQRLKLRIKTLKD